MTVQERSTRQLAAMLIMNGFPVTVVSDGPYATILHPRSRQWAVFEFIRDLGVEEGNINALYPAQPTNGFDAATWVNPSPMSEGAIADNFTRIHLTTTTV